MIDKLTVERDAERDAWQERETQLQREIESFHMRARMLESNLNKVHLQVVEAEKVREHNIFLQRRWDEEQARGMLTHEEARDLYAPRDCLSAIFQLREKPGKQGIAEAFSPLHFAFLPPPPPQHKGANADGIALTRRLPAPDTLGGGLSQNYMAPALERVEVQRDSKAEGSATRQGIGIAFERAEGGFRITSVAPESPASNHPSIRPGRLVFAVNGVPIAALAAAQVTDLIVGMPGTTVTLSLVA